MAIYRFNSSYLTLILACSCFTCAYLVYTNFYVSSNATPRRSGGRSLNENHESKRAVETDKFLREAHNRQNADVQESEDMVDLTHLRLQGGSNAEIYQNGPPPFVPAKIPLIWIGGMPRSGTTLMRALLDAHPLVRCGEETRVIPRILGMRSQWMKNAKESKRLEEAGVFGDVLDAAVSSFILNIILRHGDAASRYCNKDPFTLKSVDYLSQLFPNSKFILMIRDGRAVVHSIITRKVTITGFNLIDPKQCLEKWSNAMATMYAQCERAGPERCMPVYYEQLVLQPKRWLQEILLFLQLPWDDAVLHHEDKIGSEISLSLVERSTDQIAKPVNTDALSKWVGFYSKELQAEMGQVAPMLLQLGYDPAANPPKYGSADESVRRNTNLLHKDKDRWNDKIKELYAKNNMSNPIIQN